MKLVAIDFETANSYPQSACSIGISVFEDGIEVESITTLIKPLAPYSKFEPFNISIHHITYEDVENAPGFLHVYRILSKYFFDSYFVAHNAQFDMNVFRSCCIANDLPVPNLKYFCSVHLARKFFPYLDNHKLNTCSDYLNIELDHHNAMSDAQACAMIVVNCMILINEFDLEQFINQSNIAVKKLAG